MPEKLGGWASAHIRRPFNISNMNIVELLNCV